MHWKRLGAIQQHTKTPFSRRARSAERGSRRAQSANSLHVARGSRRMTKIRVTDLLPTLTKRSKFSKRRASREALRAGNLMHSQV